MARLSTRRDNRALPGRQEEQYSFELPNSDGLQPRSDRPPTTWYYSAKAKTPFPCVPKVAVGYMVLRFFFHHVLQNLFSLRPTTRSFADHPNPVSYPGEFEDVVAPKPSTSLVAEICFWLRSASKQNRDLLCASDEQHCLLLCGVGWLVLCSI